MRRQAILALVASEKREGNWSLSTPKGERPGNKIAAHSDLDTILLDEIEYDCKDVYAITFYPE